VTPLDYQEPITVPARHADRPTIHVNLSSHIVYFVNRLLVVTTGSCSGVVGDQMDSSLGGGGGPYRCCTADDDNAARRHLSPTDPDELPVVTTKW
jgi:hypothetical protein